MRSFNRFVSVGLLAGAVLSSAACVTRGQYDRLLNEYHGENQARRQLEEELLRKNADLDNLEGEMAGYNSQLSEAERARRLADQRAGELEAELSAAQRSIPQLEGVEIFRDGDGLVFLMENQVLFNSGSTKIGNTGQTVLMAVAKTIINQGYEQIRIDGHTDNDPINKVAKLHPTNHALSQARAYAVFEVLTNQGNVATDRITLAAYGPNMPADPGTSTSAKARNRRVEIRVKDPSR